MKIRLMVVPPGGGEIDHVDFVTVPALPREGDYVTVTRDKNIDHLVVRRVWWNFKEIASAAPHGEKGLLKLSDRESCVEVEEAIGTYTSDEDRKRLKRQGAKEFEATAY